MKLLFEVLKPYKWFIFLTLTIKSAATLVELAIPYILSYILDDVVPTKNVRSILLWGVMMVICSALALIGNVVANRMTARTTRNTSRRIRHRLFERTLTLSSAQIDRFTVPSLESRLTSDTYHVHSFLGMSMRMGVRAPLLLIGGVIVTATLDPVLTLIMLIVMPLISLSVWVITKKGIPLFKRSQRSVDSMIRVVREDSQGIRVIKALSKTDYERRRYDAANKKLVGDETRASATMSASNPLVTFILNFGLVMVVLVGAFRVNDALTQPGKIIAFIQYFTIISNAMIGITRIFVHSSKGIASMQRIAEVVNTEEDICTESEEKYPPRRDGSHILFDDVSFSYIGKTDNLSHISFSLKKGQTLGIIGATGSGKTTLTQLLMRFYDVGEGAIYIDGRDIRTVSPDELRAKFGVVMQNDFIYHGTVADNIDFGRNLTPEQIKRAAELAQAEEFIELFPEKYERVLTSKGTNISGGQKQRILIARALAADPEILVLDDSSSALDYKTDSLLRRSIRENLVGTTTVVVAQRVSSIMNADLILVLDEGRIIGAGKHEELLVSCDIYREISESQIGGAFVE
ncbi:MAG: ABC transporter ATP-binding protein [Clostridia bacterium]|nr:ABC transporter ATP-binding protein [Clostridia bacterium]